MRSGAELADWIAWLEPSERDRAVERMLGIEKTSSAPPGEHLVGHHLSGVDAILRAIREVPVRASDVVLDLGAGVGKVLALVHLLTGAKVRGVEIQKELVARAIPIAKVEHGDARTCALDGASVVFLYCPFEGPVVAEVASRLDVLDVTVCALGIDLPLQRLRRRPGTDFWMTLWDRPDRASPAPARPAVAQALAHERIDH